MPDDVTYSSLSYDVASDGLPDFSYYSLASTTYYHGYSGNNAFSTFIEVTLPERVEGTNRPDDITATNPNFNDEYWLFSGLKGNDTLTAGDGGIVAGGLGDDLITSDGGRLAAYGGLGNDTIQDNFDENASILNGGQGDDVIYGDDGQDTMRGGDGNDYLEGYGNQFQKGGQGDDTLVSSGDGTLKGGLGDDTFISPCNSGDEHLLEAYGGAGNDLFQIVEGLIWAGSGADTVEAMFAEATIRGGAGDDLITGSDEDDLILGNSGDDTLNDGGGDDEVRGGEGDDDLLIGAGNDFVHGGAGNDFIRVGGNGNGTKEIHGGIGEDTIVLRSGDGVVYAGAEDDVIRAYGGTDFNVFGGAGNDQFTLTKTAGSSAHGGDGYDEFNVSTAGSDLWGGDGYDFFVFEDDEVAQFHHVIHDYAVEEDTVYLIFHGADARQITSRVDGTIWFDEGTALESSIQFIGYDPYDFIDAVDIEIISADVYYA